METDNARIRTGRPRHWLRRVLRAALAGAVLALAGAGGFAGYVAKTNRDRADGWRDAATALEARNAELRTLLDTRSRTLDERTARLNEMVVRVEEFQRGLERSERDVRNLERRQRELAAEKAALEDERAQIALERQAFFGQDALAAINGAILQAG